MTAPVGPAGSRPHRRILASAGCGKTYALSSRYLQLVHRGENPAAVLASTFSRAAAAEIRDRVLRRAAAAVLDAGSRRELGGAIDDADFDAEAAIGLLERLVDALPALQIRTIDSLFAGMTVAFAAELGLPAEPRVLDPGEDADVLRAAILRAIGDLGEERALATLVSLGKGARKAAVVSTIARVVEGLVALATDAAPGAWDWSTPAGPSEDDLAAALAELEALAAAAAKKSIRNAIEGDLERFAQARAAGGDAWTKFFATGIVGALDQGRTSYSKVEIPAAVVAAYAPLSDAAWAGVRGMYASMTRATHELVVAVAERLRAEKRRRGVVSFDDLTRALDPAHVDLPALDEVWFRLDARVRHLLLDEFQDTSAPQWRALRPIAGEIGAHGDGSRSLFAVGDLKQSIYGWRGGEPGILEHLDAVTIDGGMVDFETRPLVESYRSSPQVIEAVNAVFERIDTNAAVVGVSVPAAERFGQWYERHATKRVDLAGFARFVELPPHDAGRGEVADDVRVREAAGAARRHWERLRGTAGRVAVLVRRNSMVGRVVAALKSAGVPASGRGGGSLFDAEAALATIQALRLAERPDDTVAAFDLARSPLAELVGFGAGATPPEAADRRRVSRDLRARIARRGAAAVVDGWRRHLDPKLDAREVVRLRQLVEVLASLESVADRSPGELVTLIQAARVDEPGGDGVTVLNVHQSKGLEYDVVVVTDLGKPLGLSGSREKVAASAPPRPTDPVPRITRWVQQGLRWDEVVPLHEDTQARAVLESLCVLYVALTRAKRGLEVHVDPQTSRKDGTESSASSTSASAVLRHALHDDERREETDVGRVLWARGDVPSADLPPPAPPEEPVAAGTAPRLRVLAPVRAARARRVRPASGRAEDRHRLFELPDVEASERGRALHACFELVEFVEDGVPGEPVLVEAVRRATPARDAEWAAARVAEFRAAIDAPAVRAALARPPGGVDLRRELRYVRVSLAGIEEGAIDRLVLHRDPDGSARAADVIDFKTGAAGGPDELIARHAAQLRAYGAVVVEQFGIPAAAVRLRILAVRAGCVVDVPAT